MQNLGKRYRKGRGVRDDFWELRALELHLAPGILGLLVTTGPTQGDRSPLSPIYRGAPNTAWIGTMTVLVTNVFLSLFASSWSAAASGVTSAPA